MDVKDKRILEALMLNARISLTQLAKKTGISREVATYRLKNLQKEIVLGYYSVINYNALGFKRYGYFIQLKGINTKKEDEFMEYLNNHEYVSYFGPVIGRWNVVLDIIARDEKHLKIISDEIIEKFDPHVESYLITGIGSEEEIYPTKIIGTIEKYSKKKTIIGKYLVDELDKKILRLLSKNARIEYQELSAKLKVAANTIKYRIKNLEKTGVIEGYAISVDYTKLGLEMYTLQFKLNSSRDEKLIAYLRTHKNIWFYYKYLGQENWDIGVGVVVKNHDELRSIMIELKNNFGELIKIHDMYLVTHIIKDNIAPEGIFK
jgi:DNA-binding Lrp family transcriptional regulator